MRWVKSDLEKYATAKEYVDTFILPVQPFQLSNDDTFKQDAFNREVLEVYVSEIEKELSGRVILTPTYYYLKTTDLNNEINRLTEWIEDIKEQPTKEIFIVTSDPQLKKLERELSCQLIWFPSIKNGDIHSKETITLMKAQVEQMSELIRTYW